MSQLPLDIETDDAPTCAVCDKPFTPHQWDIRHEVHSIDCPAHRGADVVCCECDNPVHSDCCPDCHPNKAEKIMMEKTK